MMMAYGSNINCYRAHILQRLAGSEIIQEGTPTRAELAQCVQAFEAVLADLGVVLFCESGDGVCNFLPFSRRPYM